MAGNRLDIYDKLEQLNNEGLFLFIHYKGIVLFVIVEVINMMVALYLDLYPVQT